MNSQLYLSLPPSQLPSGAVSNTRSHVSIPTGLHAPQPGTKTSALISTHDPQNSPSHELLLGFLLSARSGHGDFTAYNRCFNHTDASFHCKCGREKAPTHFYSCRQGRKAVGHSWGNLTAVDVIITASGARIFCRLAAEIRFLLRDMHTLLNHHPLHSTPSSFPFSF